MHPLFLQINGCMLLFITGSMSHYLHAMLTLSEIKQTTYVSFNYCKEGYDSNVFTKQQEWKRELLVEVQTSF